MFGESFRLFRIFGFEVRANVSWLFLALLITWSLAGALFPFAYPDLSPSTYWLMGLVGMAGLFFSLLFHELSHSLVARSYGLPVGGITLFLFGGMAELQAEPRQPREEFWMAIAGPIASVVLGAVFYLLSGLMLGLGAPQHVAGVAFYLGFINILLAVFNMVPGFPMDGGRVLRAALWQWKGDLRWATRWASRFGQGFGLLLVMLGIVSFLAGNFIGGMWWFLIGLFIRGAAIASYQHLLTQLALKGPRQEWGRTRVGDVSRRIGEAYTVDADADANEALNQMQRNASSRLVVTEDDRIVGILVLKDLLRFLQIRSELEKA
jgi:Zn-dependent protease